MTTTNLITKAIKVDNTVIHNKGESVKPFPLYQDENGNVSRATSGFILPTFEGNVKYAPITGSVASTIQNGGKIEFKVNSGSSHIINGITLYLRLSVLNAPVNLVNGFHLLDRVLVRANDGSKEIYEIHGEALYLMLSTVESEEQKYYDRMVNIGTNFTAPSAIPINTSREYHIRILNSLFHQIKFFLGGVTGDLIFEFQFKPAIQIVITGSINDITVSEAALIFNTINLDHMDFMNKKEIYASSPNIKFRFVDTIYQTTVFNNMQPSQKYEFRLQGIRDWVSHLIFFLRPSPRTGGNSTNYTQIESFNILDSSNHQLLPFDHTHEFIKYHESWEKFGANEFFLYNNAYHHCFSSSPKKSIETGSVLGFYPFDGNETLTIRTTNNHIVGSYELVVYAFVYENILFNRGYVSVTGS